LGEHYAALKVVHQAAAALSVAGFFARGLGMLRGAGWLQHRLVRTAPHVVDTVLLVSALWLAFIAGFTPGNSPWLTAKIAALLAYIGLGMLALKPGRPMVLRAAAWLAALAVFAYIVSVALTKHPAGFLRAFG